MIKFFRKNAQTIGWIIVITFVGTMFTGTFFMRGMFKQRSATQQAPQDLSNEIALIGNVPLNLRFFSNAFNNMLNRIYKSVGTRNIDPEILEYALLNAFEETFQHTAFFMGAEEQHMKVSGKELDAELAAIYKDYQLKDLRALKEFLKKNQYPYKIFITQLKEDMLARKFAMMLTQGINITDKDVENSLTRIYVQHILIKNELTSTADKRQIEKINQEVLKKMSQIKKEIFAGLSFEEAAQKYSEDPSSKLEGGDLGWFGVDELPPSFEKIAFSLEKGEVSDPVQTMMGYHLIKVIDKTINRPQDFNFDKAKESLLNTRRNQRLEGYLQEKRLQLKILDPQILAVFAKQKGDFQQAQVLYEGLIAKNPASPVPHYLLARLYDLEASGNARLQLIEDELNRASIKLELNPSYDFPELHLEMAKLYLKKKNYQGVQKELGRVWQLATQNVLALGKLKTFYQTSGDLTNKLRTEKEIERIQKLKKSESEQIK